MEKGRKDSYNAESIPCVCVCAYANTPREKKTLALCTWQCEIAWIGVTSERCNCCSRDQLLFRSAGYMFVHKKPMQQRTCLKKNKQKWCTVP
ncbi:hypothetical protein POVCU2_0030110 [Plasmodium ovale curtisi]|nr:hypothetical protein POVCU2_0030110 [Plasmodium ovale curtisi]